jgi:uncharacterized membrane protein YphA (DoxX/SURF4 family)
MRARKALPAGDSGLFEEALIVIGVVLVVAGLWTRIGALSLVAPGVVALWIGLPARAPFVVKGEPSDGRTKG